MSVKLLFHFWFCFYESFLYLFKKDFIHFYTEEKGGRKRGRERLMCGCLSHAPYCGPGLQPRHVPWLGIEPATLWFVGQCSIHWATPASILWVFSLILAINIRKWNLIIYSRIEKHEILKGKFEKICAWPVHQKLQNTVEKNWRNPTQKQKCAMFMGRKT